MSRLTPIARHRALAAIWATPPGLGRLKAVNHNILGKRFMGVALFYFLVGGVLSMLIRTQLATADNDFLAPGTYNQVFTMHGTVMMFLFAIPMIEGLTLYLLPKLLGARDLAFPRLSAFGFWCYLFGSTILLVALALRAAPDSGWFMYTPLSSSRYTPGINADVWLLGITFVEISAVAFAVEVAVSVLKVRAAGMSLARMPIFGWYMLVTAMMMLIGFPPLILGSILLEVERAFDLPFFDPARGGDPLLWQHLFWLFGHPEVYIIFLPAAGLISTMVPVFARRPLVGYGWVVASVITMGFVSFGLWVHHMFTVGIPHLAQLFFSAASMLVAIPTAVQIFSWIATLWAGRPQATQPMLYLFGFLFVFVAGGLTGVMVALVPFDWQVHDTHFVVAHLHYVLVGGFVFPMLAAAIYYLPQVTGRLTSPRLGVWAFALIFAGFNITFFLMHLTGLMGMPRRIYTYPDAFGWEWLNLVSSIGGFVMAIGFALFILDILMHARFGDRTPVNRWKAATLEWAMPAPPPDYNFGSIPEVSSREPLWDDASLRGAIAGGRGLLAEPRNGWQETLAVDMVTGKPSHIVVLPGPTNQPLHCAGALAGFFLCFLFSFYWAALAFAGLAACLLLRWAWANGVRSDTGLLSAGNGLQLPIQWEARDAPGWWGTVFTLVADGTFFASLVFGYLFLWTVAPDWPPPALMEPAVVAPTLAVLSVVAAYGLARAGMAAGTLVAGAVATLAIALHVPLLPPLTGHAYAALLAAMLGYAGFHTLLGTVIAGFTWLRRRAGYLSGARDLEMRILRLWWGYTAATTTALVVLASLTPWVTSDG